MNIIKLEQANQLKQRLDGLVGFRTEFLNTLFDLDQKTTRGMAYSRAIGPEEMNQFVEVAREAFIKEINKSIEDAQFALESL